MIINNLTYRLQFSGSRAGPGEAERRRVKEATRGLRSQAEKMAWHAAEMASLRLAEVREARNGAVAARISGRGMGYDC